MKKQLALVCLAFLFSINLFSQSIYYTESFNGRIRRASLGPTSIVSPVDFITGIPNPYRLAVAQNTSKLYYLTSGGDLIRTSLATGAFESLVISEGAMAELHDIAFYPDDDAIFAVNSPDVHGMQYIPSNNNDSGLDVQVDLDYMVNDNLNNVEVDNDAGMLYFTNEDAFSLVEMPIGSATVTVLATMAPPPTVLTHDATNNDLYFVAIVSSQYHLFRYDLDLDQLSASLANLGSNEINDIKVYPGFNKVYYSSYNTGIFSVPMSGGAPSSELATPGVGAIYIDIQADLTAPVFTTLSPADNATGVSPTQSFTITFDQNIQKSALAGTATETGIRLMKADDTQAEILDRSSANVTVSGSQATFSFTTSMNVSAGYYILIGSKVFNDPSGNNFAGISLNSAWNFTTTPGATSNNPSGIACIGTFKNYPSIIITESSPGDFRTAGSMTFGFSVAGYLLENTTGSITAAGGGDVTITSFSINGITQTITINFTVSGSSQIDVITLSGIKLKSTINTNPPATIRRTGGTGVVDGIYTNTVIANVTTQDQPAPPTISFADGNYICLNGDADAKTVTAVGISIRWYTANDLLPGSLIPALNSLATVSAQDLGLASTPTGTGTRWVRHNAGGCASLATQVDFIVVDPPQTIATGSTQQTSCTAPNGSAFVSDVDGGGTAGHSYEWFDQAMNTTGITTPTLSNAAAGAYTVRVTNSTTGCPTDAPVAIVDNIVLPSVSLSSTPNTHCVTPNGSLTATIASPQGPLTSYTFTWYDGPTSASPVNPGSVTNILSGVAAGQYTVKARYNPTGCESETNAIVTDNLTFPVATPPSSDVCESTQGAGTANVNLTTYNSALTGGAAGVSVTWRDPLDNVVTSAVVASDDTYTYTLSQSSDGCQTSGDFIFTVNPLPTPSDAGPDQTVCGTSAVLAANTPIFGTGVWAIMSGVGGNVASSSDPISTFTGVAGQTYILEWRIIDLCGTSTSQVSITFSATTTTAVAGTDQNICSGSTTLAANTPVTGTGLWTVVTGTGGTFTAATSPVSGFNGSRGTSYLLRWKITGACSSTQDDVAITLAASPTAPDAGPDQNICGTSTNLAGNTPSVGTGAWTIFVGTGGTIATPTSATSTFTGVTGVTYTLRWTISNSVCTPVTDDVIITIEPSPTVATAGTDKNICGISVAMTGNTPVTGTGLWSVVSGAGGSFTTPASPTTLFNGIAGNIYTLRWTITGACSSTQDDVAVTLVSSPTASNAGPDQSLCGTSATLEGNSPSVGTGAWTIIVGSGGTITTPTSPTSAFTGVVGVTYTLRWTISNSICTPSTDDVSITMVASPTVATAGSDKNICGNSVAMTGNTPVVGSGAWSIVSGTGGSFTTPASPTTLFSGVAGNTYTLRWTISNATCTPSTDDVIVAFVAPPTVAAAGGDQSVCNLTTTLAANTPIVGTGAWTIVSGAGGTITTPSSPTSAFSGNTDVTYTLRWTISNGICAPSTDDVTVSLTTPITTAVAGADKAHCGTSTILAGNTATSGSGLWTVVSGSGGSFVTASNPTTTFNGVAGNTYTLRWTISKGNCTASTDDVVVQLKNMPQGTGTIASLGDLCGGESASLTASGYTNVVTYEWTVPAGFTFTPSTGPTLEITAESGTGGTIRVIPQNECGDGTAATVNIGVKAAPSVNINLPESTFAGEVLTFTFTSDLSIQSTDWTLGDGTTASLQTIEHTYSAPGIYQIGLLVTATNGCSNTDSDTYTVLDEPTLNEKAIKNVITANGDSKNNTLFIENLERYPENEVKFLDRWGVEIFSRTNYQNDWEAKSRDGQFLPAGQYICIVKLLSSGKVISRTVSIIKG